MQTLTEKVFKLAPPGGLFDETVVRNVFPEASEGARKLHVHRATSCGEVLRLRPGLFMLAREFRKSEAHPFAVAAALHYPSHVSLESALAFHGLIPEAVYQVSSVTESRSREFRTPLGVFTFQRVPARSPLAGTETVQVDGVFWVFVATPLRAIADLVYLNRTVSWETDGSAFLTESMRIEKDDLRTISFRVFDAVRESIRDKRTREYLLGLREELGTR